MLISDLEYLEVVREENSVEGGEQFVAISSMSGSALTDGNPVYISGSSSANAFDNNYYYGRNRGVSASSSAYGSAYPYYY